MLEFECAKCGSHYKLSDEYAGKRVGCRKCGHVFLVEQTPPIDKSMPDFDSLFTALAEEERQAPTLEDTMTGI